MGEKTKETLAAAASILGVAAALAWPLRYETASSRRNAPPGARVITLTAVAATGTWTEADVTASNYWRVAFPPARPVLRPGETVLLRLKSADVVHRFYSPGLGIGPMEVYPGHIEEAVVTARSEGVFPFYCTSVCGLPHFRMRGTFAVTPEGKAPPPEPPDSEPYWLAPPPMPGSSRVARGHALYNRMGCVACHGRDGRGGVPNWNYVKDTVPSHDTLAERLMLTAPEDAKVIVDLINRGVPLESLADNPPVPRYNLVLAKYNMVRDVIRNGNAAGKKDPKGLPPPLDMPSWEQRLSANDIDSIIAYLITLEPWDKEKL